MMVSYAALSIDRHGGASKQASTVIPGVRKRNGGLAAGHAHSVEAWEGCALAGRLYGVSMGRAAFFGESVFSRRRDASKVALARLVERLEAGGFLLLDSHFMTDHLRQFGGMEIDRGLYRRLLRQALLANAKFG